MADQAALRRNVMSQRRGNGFDDVIARIVAVHIVKRFEVIKIEIAETKGYFVAQ